MVTRLCEQSGE